MRAKLALALLLLDQDPSMRLVERNLRETAEIEVAVRLLEIRRELQIRSAIGDQKWSRMVQVLRFARQMQALPHAAPQLTERLRELQDLLDAAP